MQWEQIQRFLSVWTLKCFCHLSGRMTITRNIWRAVWLRNVSVRKLFGQKTTLWTTVGILICFNSFMFFNALDWANDIAQWEQPWGFYPVRTLKCLCRLRKCPKDLEHRVQLKSFSSERKIWHDYEAWTKKEWLGTELTSMWLILGIIFSQ